MAKTRKDVFEKFYPKLTEVLPLCVDVLVSTLYSKMLLSNSHKDKISSFTTAEKKSQCFLDEVIKPGINTGYTVLFDEMLRIMESSNDSVVNHLAEEIIGNQSPTGAPPKGILRTMVQVYALKYRTAPD